MEDGNRAYREGGGIEVVLETVVRCTEIDINDHVNNAKFVEYLEWGREEWYERHGFPYDCLRGLARLPWRWASTSTSGGPAARGTGCASSPGQSAAVARALHLLSGSNKWTAPSQLTRPSPSSPSIRTPVAVGPCRRSSAASFQLPPESTGRPSRVSAQPASLVASRRRPGRRLAAVLSRRGAPTKTALHISQHPMGKRFSRTHSTASFRLRELPLDSQPPSSLPGSSMLR